MDIMAHKKAKYVVYPSNWAAQSAIAHYNIDNDKVKVINFGTTIDNTVSDEKFLKIVNNKFKKNLKIFFAAMYWERKGGDIVIEVFKNIRKKLSDAELHIAGISPDFLKNEKNVYLHGFLKKDNPEEYEQLKDLYKTSHFFFVPSRAETFGMVFTDATSFGLPSITSNVGGIPEVIINGKNGFNFAFDNIIEKAEETILKYYHNPDLYKKLSFDTFAEYKNRLNWDVAGKQFQKLLLKIK
jgi:glycosyltransferase involved in cell wall biosynthesis